jgi:hypothetical protein
MGTSERTENAESSGLEIWMERRKPLADQEEAIALTRAWGAQLLDLGDYWVRWSDGHQPLKPSFHKS